MQRIFLDILARGILLGQMLFVVVTPASAQDPTITEPPLAGLGPSAFQQWVEDAGEKVRSARLEPMAITNAILARLSEGADVTDNAVFGGVASWIGYEASLAEHGSDSNRYKRTIAIIQKIESQLYARPQLRAKLLVKKAELYRRSGDLPKATATRQLASEQLELLYERTLELHVDNLTALGGELYADGKKREAEKVFGEVLSFPWHRVKPPTRQVLKDCYFRAGRGLIDCRRGNLKALQNTYFVPAATHRLGPYLNKALTEAGGKPRNVPDDPEGIQPENVRDTEDQS